MIIKKISIENYLCYCGVKEFELSDGLNIILGENGEGKTKIFEAIDWLFNGRNSELNSLVSAKTLNDTVIGEEFRVRVAITVEQYDEKKIISKSFTVKKTAENECSTASYMLEGIEETKSGEREQVDGQKLLDRIFPFQIRKYSMFKGESELNIFESEDALTNLINLFSDAKHYEKYSEKGAFLREKAEKAVEDSTKADSKNKRLYEDLEADIARLQRERQGYQVHLNSTLDEIKKLEVNLQFAERYVDNADALDTINKRIKGIEEKISDATKKIDENYTTSLFDERWIAVNFEPIHKVFADKINQLSFEKRKQQTEFDKEQGIKEGERKALAKLLNNTIPLPANIPSKQIMQEMLNAEICKVCNREAKKGSEAYVFMKERLDAYEKTQEPNKNEARINEQLFKINYTDRLVNLNVSHEDNLKKLREVRTQIKDLFEFNNDRKKDIEILTEQLEKERSERERILGNSSIGEDKLNDVLKNYTGWQRDLKQKGKEQIDYESKLKDIESQLKNKNDEKDKIDLSSANSFLIKTRAILRDIETIFNDTKEKKFDEFIEKLETKSNNIFKDINIDAFTGTIVFNKKRRSNKTIVEIELQEAGRPFYKPNQSLLTSMHISILFAISELTTEIQEEKFPMIFDAPTSSFGENKTEQFLNLIYNTGNQKILLIKDFLYTDKNTKVLSIKDEFKNVKRNKAFWVKLERPFDPNNLKSINTQVITL
jgi:DNA sulfur modification protein DndD